MLVKFCGATTAREVTDMAGAGADLVGLWHGVPGGRNELGADRLGELARAARDTGTLRPVLVTFSSQARALLDVVETARVPYVQLHGFQAPHVVKALRRDGSPGLRIVKVLHLRRGGCVEGRLTGAYARAGADWFLLDAVTDEGRIGSTGHTLEDDAVTALADRVELPFLLAGGLSAGSAGGFAGARAHPRFLGIDVDSAARGRGGLLRAGRAQAVVRAWRSR